MSTDKQTGDRENRFHPDKLQSHSLELLILLMEECGEVIQAASKCVRCIDYVHNSTGISNVQQLKIEMIDLEIIMRTVRNMVLPTQLTYTAMQETKELRDAKMEKLKKWTNVFQDNNQNKEG